MYFHIAPGADSCDHRGTGGCEMLRFLVEERGTETVEGPYGGPDRGWLDPRPDRGRRAA